MKKILFVFLLFIVSKGMAQFTIPELPENQTSLYDYVNLLNKSGARFLEEKLIKYSDSTSTQIVIIIIDSTKGEEILDLATRWGNEWGIGQKEKDNGIVLLMAKEDREIAISVGSGFRDQLTYSKIKKIIDNRITPKFKKQHYYFGLRDGIDGIFQVLEGAFDGKPIKDESTGIISDAGSTFIDKIFRNIGVIIFTMVGFIFLLIARKSFPEGSNDYWDDDHWDHDQNRDRHKIHDFDDFDDSDGFDDGFGGGDFDGDGASGSW